MVLSLCYHDFLPQVTQVLGEIDEDLGYLMERLEEPKLRGLNLMIVSDHGFADLAEPLYLEDCIDSSKYRLVDNNPVMSIWPHDTGERCVISIIAAA